MWCHCDVTDDITTVTCSMTPQPQRESLLVSVTCPHNERTSASSKPPTLNASPRLISDSNTSTWKFSSSLTPTNEKWETCVSRDQLSFSDLFCARGILRPGGKPSSHFVFDKNESNETGRAFTWTLDEVWGDLEGAQRDLDQVCRDLDEACSHWHTE